MPDIAWIPSLTDILQVLLLTCGIYYVLRFLRGTRAAQVLVGLASLLLLFFLITAVFQLDVINIVLRWVSLFLFFALLVVFHQEIRLALAILGRNTYRRLTQGRMPETPTEEIVRVARMLADRRIGALIAIERTDGMDRWCETGIALDAVVSAELLVSVFTPPLPLHDGGVIIRGSRIRAAHCIFPINNELRLDGMGTRHRAALTLSGDSDALILVVSEERGQVSVARDGNLMRNLSDRQVRRLLRAAFVPQEAQRDFYARVFGATERAPWFVRPFLRKAPSASRAASAAAPSSAAEEAGHA